MNGTPISTLGDAESVAASVLSGIGALRDAEWWKFERDDLLSAGRLLETTARSVYAAQMRWTGEVHDAGIADRLSMSSTRVLLRDTLCISAADAAGRVRAAKMLLPHEAISGGNTPTRLPRVAAAMDAGEIGEDHVAVITRAVRAWPRTLGVDLARQAEALLVDQARDTDPGHLAKAAEQLAQILDPDGTLDGDRDPTRDMELRLGRRNPRTGLTPLTGTLGDEAVETFRQATTALAAPRPAVDGVTDPRSPANRLAHAHWEVLRRSLDTGTGPGAGGQLPHVAMTVQYDALTTRLGQATLEYGGPIPPGVARRLLCDCAILPVVMNGPSRVLDVGRTQRLFPPHLRKALALRDGGCAWPGCDRPAGWCQAHHITSWLDGGETSLANGTLLCLYHHQQAHRGDWQIRIGTDARPDFIPPPWIDPHQTPRRNHHHTVIRQ